MRLLVLLSTISTKLYSNARAASFDSVRTGVFKPDSPLHGLILLFLQKPPQTLTAGLHEVPFDDSVQNGNWEEEVEVEVPLVVDDSVCP